MKIKTELNKIKTYVLACSFGPDSMALLDLAIKDDLKLVVAHVNYHHRKESDYEKQELRKYCEKHNLPIEVLETNDSQAVGNFEAWAREKRYRFFAEIAKKYNAEAILVAHHQDDLIETYLMQKKRGGTYKNWGIAEENIIFGCKIIRPLLDFKKSEILSYCEANNIPFSIDSTNLESDLTRNKIRHEIVEKMSDEERGKIINEIKEKQVVQRPLSKAIDKDIFLSLDYGEVVALISNELDEHRNISIALVDEIKKAIKSNKANIKFEITKNLSLYYCYGVVYLVHEPVSLVEKRTELVNKKFNNDYIDIDFSLGAEDRGIKETDYPLYVDKLSGKESYLINDYEVEVRRLFIDWKLPVFLRKTWPGIFNKDGKLIYIPRYRKDFKEKNKSKFVINLEKIIG